MTILLGVPVSVGTLLTYMMNPKNIHSQPLRVPDMNSAKNWHVGEVLKLEYH